MSEQTRSHWKFKSFGC